MRTIENVKAMRAWSREARKEGARIALVPTMGGLHDGHLSLIEIARRHADRVVASVFVNPTQFDRDDDFAGYPRDLARDQRLLAEAGVDVVFAPDAATVYPEGAVTFVDVEELSAPLCGAHRPGHFRGVATIVTKLFTIIEPDVGVFGEKDYQQLAIIRRLARDLCLAVEVVGAPIVREADGLAMSSRNMHLDTPGRAAAVCLSRALHAAEALVANGESDGATIEAAARAAIEAEPLAKLEYASLVDAEDLDPVTTMTDRGVLALAVWIGKTRLIDNQLLVARAASAERRSA